MRYIIITIVLLFLNVDVNSQNLKIGDTLYVWAESGLILRENSNINSEAITTIPYGISVILVDNEPKGFHNYNEIDEYEHKKVLMPAIKYKGRFYKVKYLDFEGYIFNGLLSTLPTLNIRYNESREFFHSENLKSYFNREFGILIILRNRGADTLDYWSQRIVYNNGIILDEEKGVSWWNYSYIIPDISMNEAYLLVNILRDFEKYYKRGIDQKWSWLEFHPIYFKEDAYHLQTGPFEETVIKKENKFIVLTMGGGN